MRIIPSFSPCRIIFGMEILLLLVDVRVFETAVDDAKRRIMPPTPPLIVVTQIMSVDVCCLRVVELSER